MISLLIPLYILIALFDLFHLKKNKKRYELSILFVFFLSAFVLSVLQAYGITIPSPIKGVQYIIKDVLHFGYGSIE